MTSTQSWQAKKIFAALLLAFTALLSACDDPTNIGSELELDANALSTTYADTFTIQANTLKTDSVITTRGYNLLVGNYTDPILGKVSSQAYFQVSLPTSGTTVSPFKLADGVIYDSLVVSFISAGQPLGDTTQTLNLSLHRLTEDYNLKKAYQNTESLSYASTPLASKAVKLKKYAAVDTVRLRLSDTFGQELFALSGKDEAATDEKFKTVFKGFVLKPTTETEKLLLTLVTSNISSNTNLRLYYHKSGDTGISYFSFPLGRDGKFNQTNSDFAKTIAQKQISNKNFVQIENGAGLGMRVQIPYLKQLAKINQVAINKAELVIEPEKQDWGLPQQLSITELEADNAFARTGNAVRYLPQQGNDASVQVASYNKTNNNYTFNITSYISEWVRGKRDPKGWAILATSSESNATYGTLVWHNDNLHHVQILPKNVKLKIYYSGVK